MNKLLTSRIHFFFHKAIVVGLLFLCYSASAQTFNIEKNDTTIKNSPFRPIHISINQRQDTIQKYWGNLCGPDFQIQIDHIQLYIEAKIADKKSKEKYLNSLYEFLLSIEGNMATSYFSSGRYLAVLQFFPAIIDYNESHRLLELLNQDKLLALKSIRLFKNEKEAEPFLRKYADENPDDILRNVNEFADMSYASSIVLYCAGISPLSAERYLGGFNSINRIIKTSDLYLSKTLTRLDSIHTNRHNRFLFLDYYMRDTFPAFDISSLQSNKVFFFKELATLHFRPGVWGKYSIDRELSLLSSDIIREINFYYSNGYRNNIQSILSSFTPEELYLIFIYGYQDATIYSFNSYLELLKYKSKQQYGASFYNSISTVDLVNFLAVAEKFERTNEIIGITADDYKNQLLKNLSSDENNSAIAYNKYLDNFVQKELNQPPKKIAPVIVSSNEVREPVRNEVKTLGVNVAKTLDVQEMKAPIATEVKEPNVINAKEPVAAEVKEPDFKIDHSYELNNTLLSNPVTTESSVITLAKKNEIQDEVLSLQKKEEISLDELKTTFLEPTVIIPPITIRITAEEQITYSLLKNLDENLGNMTFVNSFIDKSYAKKVLTTIANTHPDMIFKYTKNLQSKYWVKELLEDATRQAPSCYKRYLPNENHPVNWILQHSQDSVVVKMNTMYKSLGYRSNAYNLMDDIMTERKSPAACDSITRNEELNFLELINIVIRNENSLGKHSVESDLQNLCLLKVRKINDINSVTDDVRFLSIKDFTAEQLYVLMIYGEDELFKNSFNGVFQRFVNKIPAGGGYQFLQNIHFLHFRTFLKICGNFGRTDEFLNKMSADERLLLIGLLTKNLEAEKYNPSEVIFVAEAIPGFTNPTDRGVINTTIKSEFERLQKANDGTGMLLYGLLASVIQKSVVAEKNWFQQISNSFELPLIDRIKISDLVNQNHQCIQQHFFYDDEDGRSSFANFMACFKSMPNYTIESFESYVEITSTGGVNKVMIFANKPEYEQNGMNEIQKVLKLNNWEPTVIVHRGHSFHTEKTLNIIPENTKLLIVGSCGGYYKLPIAIERAPDAHIISTKQIGTMRVNDPIIKLTCEKIRLNQDIVWVDFWKEVELLVGKTPMFYDYVPPNKNLGSLFLNAYYKAIDLASLKDLN
jgi:hypothetical protein